PVIRPRLTGARVKRVEDPRLLRGRGRYLDDVVLPRMVSLAFVRSPHAHAVIRWVDASAARRLEGVLAVLTAGDLRSVARPLAPRLDGDGFTPTAWPVLADWDGETLTVWASTQTPSIMLTALAFSLGLPETRVRVIAPDVGGGFGLKTHVFPEDVAVAASARVLGRPVKWVEERRESLAAGSQARAQRMDVEVAAEAD